MSREDKREDFRDLAVGALFGLVEERVLAIYLDDSGRIMSESFIGGGGRDAAFVIARQLFLEGLAAGSTQFLLAHNHPSGVCRPSQRDRETTRLLIQVGDLLGMTLKDHLIVAGSSVFSMKLGEEI